MYAWDDISNVGRFAVRLGSKMGMPYLTVMKHKRSIELISIFFEVRYGISLHGRRIEELTEDMFNEWILSEHLAGTTQQQMIWKCSELMCFLETMLEEKIIKEIPWTYVVPTLQYLEKKRAEASDKKYDPELDFVSFCDGADWQEGIMSKFEDTFKHYERVRESKGYFRSWNVYCLNVSIDEDGNRELKDIRFIEKKNEVIAGEEEGRLLELIRAEERSTYEVVQYAENMYAIIDEEGKGPLLIMIPADNNVYYYKKG